MTTTTDYSPSFTLNGLTFNTYDQDVDVPAPGTGWFASLSGWEAAPRRTISSPNITEDGDSPVDMTLAPRQLTIKGVVVVRTTSSAPGAVDAALEAARNTFLRAVLVSPAAMVNLQVSEVIPTEARVHGTDDAPQWDRIACSDADTYGLARFQAGLVAPGGVKLAQTAVVTPLGAGIAVPAPTASASNTGGSLTAATYGYRVSAVNGSGETAVSREQVVSLAPLVSPNTPSVTPGFGGSLPSGSYSYKVSAVNSAGETLVSFPGTITFGGSFGSVFSLTVGWAPVAGATGYNVYGRSGGSYLKINTSPVVGTSFIDTGALTPSGAAPGSNTTGTTTGTVTLNWPAVPGATGYNVYGRTVAGELKMTPTPIAGLTFTDDGSVTPSGALPAAGFSTTVTNAGDYETEPTLTVTGPGATSPITLTIGGRALVVETAVGSGQTLVVDAHAKTVTLNGVSRLDLLANSSQWPELAPGANSVGYSGGGTASLSHQAAYA